MVVSARILVEGWLRRSERKVSAKSHLERQDLRRVSVQAPKDVRRGKAGMILESAEIAGFHSKRHLDYYYITPHVEA